VPAFLALIVEEEFGDRRHVHVAALALRARDARLQFLGDIHDGLRGFFGVNPFQL